MLHKKNPANELDFFLWSKALYFKYITWMRSGEA